jgi:hypothetical protein
MRQSPETLLVGPPLEFSCMQLSSTMPRASMPRNTKFSQATHGGIATVDCTGLTTDSSCEAAAVQDRIPDEEVLDARTTHIACALFVSIFFFFLFFFSTPTPNVKVKTKKKKKKKEAKKNQFKFKFKLPFIIYHFRFYILYHFIIHHFITIFFSKRCLLCSHRCSPL